VSWENICGVFCRIKLRFNAFRFEHKITGKKFLDHASSVGRRMSSIALQSSDGGNQVGSM